MCGGCKFTKPCLQQSMASKARQQAQAENLTLLVAENKTGYFGVAHQPGRPKPYQAQVSGGGKLVYLGSFATAEEAALCVARSPEGQRQAQRSAAEPVPLTSEEARQQAQAEGLTLAGLTLAAGSTGYFGVSHRPNRSKPYNTHVRRGGKMVHLGCFATAEEAALHVARSPEGKAAVEKAAAWRSKRKREVCYEPSTDRAAPYVGEPVPWKSVVVNLACGRAGDSGARAYAALKSNFAQWKQPATLNGGFFFCGCYPEDTLVACIRVRWDAPLRYWELGESYSSIIGGSSSLLQEVVRYLWAVPAAKKCSIKAIAAGESAVRRYKNFVMYAPGTETGMCFVPEKGTGEAASTPAAVVFTMDWPHEI